mmetsp:Transcript_13550/g.25068  ORF Transcript_13550/g.25068 Transcript_13550/m.25068 type:complete len:333 (+) Transcript_13550:45-1043(+)
MFRSSLEHGSGPDRGASPAVPDALGKDEGEGASEARLQDLATSLKARETRLRAQSSGDHGLLGVLGNERRRLSLCLERQHSGEDVPISPHKDVKTTYLREFVDDQVHKCRDTDLKLASFSARQKEGSAQGASLVEALVPPVQRRVTLGDLPIDLPKSSIDGFQSSAPCELPGHSTHQGHDNDLQYRSTRQQQVYEGRAQQPDHDSLRAPLLSLAGLANKESSGTNVAPRDDTIAEEKFNQARPSSSFVPVTHGTQSTQGTSDHAKRWQDAENCWPRSRHYGALESPGAEEDEDPFMLECVGCGTWVEAELDYKSRLCIGYCCDNILISQVDL